MRLTHVRLLVNDYAACFRFYREVLALDLIVGVEDGVYAEFGAGDCRVGLYGRRMMADVLGAGARDDAAKPMDRVALTFLVPSVDEAYEALKERGVVFETEPTDRRDWYLRTAHFRDPDGNLIEIYENLSMEGSR